MSTMKCVDLIPQETENEPITFRSSPSILILSDLWLIIGQLPYLPYLILPLRINLKPPFVNLDSTPFSLLFQVLLFLNSLFAIFLLSISLWFLPILILPLIALQTQFLLWIQGPVKIPSSKRVDSNHSEEAWFFVNGIATSRSGAKLAIQRLQELFDRPVVGIYNRTLGIIADLAECVVQRDLDYATEDIRRGYSLLKEALQDKNKKKVVCCAHSQGGICVSAWVDQLLADVSAEDLEKLEVYTFASAANHFSSPINLSNERSIKHVEHFVNDLDPVSRIGVLAFSNPAQVVARRTSNNSGESVSPPVQSTTRFYGRLFVRPKTGGHLLLEHYLGRDSILDDPLVKQKSRFVKYLKGSSP